MPLRAAHGIPGPRAGPMTFARQSHRGPPRIGLAGDLHGVVARILAGMGSVADLQASVAAAYNLLEMPSWPDPHPEMTSPLADEYSRVTQPERYRIVQARARAWSHALRAMPGVEAETLAPAPLDTEGHLGHFDRGVRLTSPRLGSLALLLLERDADVHQWDAGALPVRVDDGRRATTRRWSGAADSPMVSMSDCPGVPRHSSASPGSTSRRDHRTGDFLPRPGSSPPRRDPLRDRTRPPQTHAQPLRSIEPRGPAPHRRLWKRREPGWPRPACFEAWAGAVAPASVPPLGSHLRRGLAQLLVGAVSWARAFRSWSG